MGTPLLSSSLSPYFPIHPFSKRYPTITPKTSQEINVLFLNEGVITPLLLETNRGEFLFMLWSAAPAGGLPHTVTNAEQLSEKGGMTGGGCVRVRRWRCSVARGGATKGTKGKYPKIRQIHK